MVVVRGGGGKFRDGNLVRRIGWRRQSGNKRAKRYQSPRLSALCPAVPSKTKTSKSQNFQTKTSNNYLIIILQGLGGILVERLLEILR